MLINKNYNTAFKNINFTLNLYVKWVTERYS